MHRGKDGGADWDRHDYVLDMVAELDARATQAPAVVRDQLGEWVVEYFVRPQNGGPVIWGLFIHPGAIDAPYESAPVPPGGIGARLLRRLRPADAQRFARSELADRARPEDPLSDAVAFHGYDERALHGARRPGRRGLPDRFYAEIAADYVQALDAGSRHPVKDVAARKNYSRSYVRDVISGARHRGLLTQTYRGRAEGQLTEKARGVLEAGSDHQAFAQHETTAEHRSAKAPEGAAEHAPPDKQDAGPSKGELDRQLNRRLSIE